jgi:4-hydroxy-tetrahydrodipicolinate synthase
VAHPKLRGQNASSYRRGASEKHLSVGTLSARSGPGRQHGAQRTRKHMMFSGTYSALVTPFRNDEIDYPALSALIEQQVSAGIAGLVPCGSTGESATLSHAEHERLIAFTVEQVAGRVQVIAGTGSNNTKESIRLTQFAKSCGADGALLIAPYYNRPTQEGLYAHHSAIANAVELPQLLYNIPGRTGVNIEPATIARLSEISNIVGVKDASGSLDQVSRTIEACPPGFVVLSGDDSLTLPILSVGGRGVIAVISNLLPEKLCALVTSWQQGNAEEARRIHYELLPLMRALGLATNPIPVKAALASLGLISDEIRLPLTPLQAEHRKTIGERMAALGLVR